MNLIILIITILIGGIFILYYNLMLVKENKVHNAYSLIDIMLKKRNDLIPNLVNTVKGMMKHEKELFEELIKLRNQLNSDNINKSIIINNEISKQLNNLLALSENYPSLKSNQSFLSLQKELCDMEDMISAARRTYNAHVTSYNSFISYFPNFLFAKLFHFKKYQLFEISKEDRKGHIYYENQE